MPETPAAAVRSAVVLALDSGSKKTGVAVGNRITGGARPLGVVRGSRGRQLAAILALVAEWQPGQVVVGLPLHADGTAHRQTARVRDFARALAARLPAAVPVALADERHSTQLARRSGRGGVEKGVDAAAAAVILQNWLDNPALSADSALV